jgi:hypothetical protein
MPLWLTLNDPEPGEVGSEFWINTEGDGVPLRIGTFVSWVMDRSPGCPVCSRDFCPHDQGPQRFLYYSPQTSVDPPPRRQGAYTIYVEITQNVLTLFTNWLGDRDEVKVSDDNAFEDFLDDNGGIECMDA